MSNLQRKLNEVQKADLASQVAQMPGPKGGSAVKRTIQDQDGEVHTIGGEIKQIYVDGDGIPFVTTEKQRRILDCGCVSGNFDKIGGMSASGRIQCDRHSPEPCPECGTSICEDESEMIDGKRVCKDHEGFDVAGMIGIIVLVLAVLMLPQPVVWLRETNNFRS